MIKNIIITFLLIVIAVLVAIFVSRKKQINSLSNQIELFENDEKIVEYSLKDNALSTLQNNVFDMENKIMFEKSNAESEGKKNRDFIADISHQLKTPISALKLYLELDKADNSQNHIENELILVEKMENLILEILKLEKIKGDVFEMTYSEINASDFINPIVSSLQVLYPNKNFVVEASGDFRCDKQWLSEAVLNVVKNACEHTNDDGAINISVISDKTSTNIEVVDDGGGVDENDISNIFNRFYKTQNGAPSNTGLGLAITKEIVEKHHGVIMAKNKGEGLLISITLPKIDGIITI